MRYPVIALTGPMCAGKNCVSSILEQSYGCVAVDADVVCHDVLAEQSQRIISMFEQPAAEYGIVLTNDNQTLNRRALGSLLFKRPELLAAHEKVIHPIIDTRIDAFIEQHVALSPVIINATVLYKTPSITRCSALVYVTAPVVVRFLRARKRDCMPAIEIVKRFYAQRNLFTQYSRFFSDIYKVNNCGTRINLERQLHVIMKTLLD